ncbi:hypothetical protein V6N11_034883 [Hibiscus sabdariffa]|uniref:DEAD-box RNA helicase Q domain-containing protein n=1 Tax=Hibiscus sabdariffa TaxID=183260 RepID=A0ABR1ZEU7_9ROSI
MAIFSMLTRSNIYSPQPIQTSRGRGGSFGPRFIDDDDDELEVVDDTLEEANLTKNAKACDDIRVEASGVNIPPPVSSFSEMDLGDAINRNLKRCNFVNPTPIQRHAIPIAFAGRDLVACAPTGAGKTAAICFSIICRVSHEPFLGARGGGGRAVACPLALILAPTRESSSQVSIISFQVLICMMLEVC